MPLYHRAKQKIKLSPVSTMHYIKLIFRSILFLIALCIYILHWRPNSVDLFGANKTVPLFLIFIWIVFAIEMLFRFFPSNLESPGCQKQFAKKYRPRKKLQTKGLLHSAKSTFSVFLAWILLNAVIGGLYFVHLIDKGILLLICLAYSICDMICILFFCPFQTWFMKNKCCTTCRIYNWDFAMMFTPFVFIPSFYTWSLLLISLILLAVWEMAVFRYPERFSEETNASITCANCNEKLCHHKTQLQHFLKKRNQLLKHSFKK